ncbi:DoxX family membrane protein [Streptomyces sp. NPDC058067]|uniref:DoxX family protein n=1 Tax=Streptomyces sp. NPDC058067 TaxID=3346324 RepID=UPI0036E9A7F8
MDTRTPRTPTGDRSPGFGPGFDSGFDDGPALSMVKVPCDPAQVVVSHASFRVQLPRAQQAQSPRISRHLGSLDQTARIPVVGAAAARRRAPVVWSGRSAPGDPGATGLLQAARRAGESTLPRRDFEGGDGGATQVIPRIDLDTDLADDATGELPTVTDRGTRLLPQQMRQAGSAFEEAPYQQPPYGNDELTGDGFGDGFDDGFDDGDKGAAARRHGADPVRHAYYPGRRMNLGVVLLPLRVFLGFISIYAGMGKLCDPVYFDGGDRGSMVKWLNSLHPWALAEPLRDFALQHPVGAGLCIAFLQVVVGVLTVLGLWQRVAAVFGALLSAALIVTVSWKTVPAYDAPDIIYLAAWSPLIIAGAPVYSVDGRLAGGAWRRLGPRAELWELRRYVLRRGAVVTTVVVGLTLLIGSLLGGAVRDAGRVTAPGPGEAPRNELPGSPLPSEPGHKQHRPTHSAAPNTPTQGATSAKPSGAASSPGAAPTTSGAGQPSQTQGTGQAPPRSAPPAQQPPATSSGPSSGGGTGAGGGTGGSDSGSGGSGGGDKNSGLLGGVLGG